MNWNLHCYQLCIIPIRFDLKKSFLADPFWDHWYPCFGFLVTTALGFKDRVGSALFTFCRGKCNVDSLRSTSGDRHADLLVAVIAVSHFPTCLCRGGTQIRMDTRCTRYHCARVILIKCITTLISKHVSHLKCGGRRVRYVLHFMMYLLIKSLRYSAMFLHIL